MLSAVSMMLPDELEWVLQMLGYNWPTADEDKLRDSAALWRKFGDDVTGLHTSANTSARTVTAHNAGESIDAFTKTYAKFDGGGGSDGYLADAAQAAHIIANVMEACAYLVEFAKWAVIAQLIALAIQIIAAQAAAPFTFGLSEVGALGATQAARLIVRRLLDELKQALMEAIVEAMKEPAISAIEAIISDLVRQTVNVGFGAQQGYDLSETAKAGAKGGWEAIKQTPQTLAEGVRDGLGKKAGDRAHHAIDSRIDGYDGSSGTSGSNGDGGDGGSGSRDGGGRDSEGRDSGSRDSGDSNSDSNSRSSDSNSSGSDSSTRTSNGTGPGANIGGGISADSGGPGIGTPDVGVGPNSDSGSDSGQSPSSSDTPYSRPTPSLSAPSLSDFDDPSPGGTSPSTPDTSSSSGSPSTSGPSGTHSGSSVSGLSSPTAQSAPTPTSSGATSSSPGSGTIGTSIDSLAASVPTQSNAAPTPTPSDPSPAATGGRADGGSAIPTSPVSPSTGGTTAGSQHTGGTTPGGTSSATSPTGPTPNSGAARNPSAGTPSTTGTGPASTPSPTSATTPRSTPTPDGRVPGTADGRSPGAPGTPVGRTPGTPDGRTPGTPDGRTPGAADGRTAGTPDGRTPAQRTPGTTPGDGTSPRNNPGTRPGDSTSPRSTPDPTGGTRTHTPGQNPSTPSPSRNPGQNPGQNPSQSTPSRTASPSTSTPTTTPSPSSGAGPERASTPSSGTPSSSTQSGPATSTSTPGAPGTGGTQNQPGTGSTPTRPPHQPAGSTPNTPNTPNAPQQPAAQPNTPPQNTPPNPQHQQQQQQQVTAVPIHTVITTPGATTTPSHATPDTPQAPGSPQTDSGTPQNQQHPQQDSLEDIRADLDHDPGGLSEPDPDDQQALADAVPHNEDGTPERFPDPFGPWTQLQNDGGNEVPGRSNNCADCSRSFLETWYGNPQVSAPRTLDTDEHGNLDPWSPEDNANENQIRWTGAAHTYAGPGGDPDTANNIASTLQQAGPGSAAIVQVDWPGGGGHAFNVVNHDGNIVWIDTQSGEVSDQPLHIDNAEHVWHIPLDANRNPIDLTQPDAADSESQNDESQNHQDEQSQPEASEDNGQPENGQNSQNDVSEADSPQPADQATPEASNKTDPAQPSTADPSMSPDPNTPDGREPSQDTPEARDSNADPQRQPQSRPDEATHPDEQGRTPDKESEQPTATTESPTRPDSPSEDGQRPAHTTPGNTANTDNGTPDKDATNRDTPQQTTTPSDPRTSIPHQQSTDPRATDPRTADPRTSDPRTSDPHRDTPTQTKPETDDRPDGQRPNQTRPDHVDGDPQSGTPDKDRSDTPDQTRPADPNQSPADDHRDRPSDMTKDSSVPTRESLPDGKNADAANYVKDSVNGKKPLYGDIAAEHPAQNAQSASPERTAGPAEPAAGTPDANDQESRRQRDLDMLARANSDDPKDKAWFEKYYHPNSGYRRSVTAPAEDGRPVPQLHPTNDPNARWMLANDTPDADPESYIDEGEHKGKRDEEISEANLEQLDKYAKARQNAIDADRQPHLDRQAAKEAYEANKTPENLKTFQDADAKHSPLHGKMTRASEDYGEAVAEFHVMPQHFEDYNRVDDRAMGNNRFDQIWMDPSKSPPEFVVVEAKGSTTAELGQRRGIPPEHGSDQAVSSGDPSQAQGDGGQNEDEAGQDNPSPGVPKVRQGTRPYFETILHEMEKRARRTQDNAETDAELAAGEAERKLARDLRKALEANPSRVKYILVKGNSDEGEHRGYEMYQFDIRTEEEKERDANSAT
ncbi:toxin glutamine deamidase domain-containing protein [Streptomyces sp. NPDC051954]|uniref:toxin glutamine deamidase domain-containing protein n=1 Tax=Streptomyces sp. NPDC051954 TaxID=3155524 RepID=UPI003433BF71